MRGVASKFEMVDHTEVKLTIRIGLPLCPHSIVADVERQEILKACEELLGSFVEIKKEKEK